MADITPPRGQCQLVRPVKSFTAFIKVRYIIDVVTTTETVVGPDCNGDYQNFVKKSKKQGGSVSFSFGCRFKKNPLNPDSNEYVFMNEDEYLQAWDTFVNNLGNKVDSEKRPNKLVSEKFKEIRCEPPKCEKRIINGQPVTIRVPARVVEYATLVYEQTDAFPRVAQATATSSSAVCTFS
jgi:hypothetical protein